MGQFEDAQNLRAGETIGHPRRADRPVATQKGSSSQAGGTAKQDGLHCI